MQRTDTDTKVSFTDGTYKLECRFSHGSEEGQIDLNFEERELANINSTKWLLAHHITHTLSFDQAIYLAGLIVEAVNNCKKEEALCANCE